MLAGPVAVGEVVAPGDAGVRAERIFEIIRAVLAARATFTDLPHIRSFTTNLDDLPAYGTVRRKLLPAANPAGQHHRRSQSALPARRGAGGGGRGGGDPRPPMNLHNPFTRRARTAVMIWCVGSRIMVAVVVVVFLGIVAVCSVLPVLREVSFGRGNSCMTPSDEPARLAAERVLRQPPEGAAPDGEPGFRPACEYGGPASYFVQYTSRLDDEQLARYYRALAGESAGSFGPTRGSTTRA